VLTNPQSRRRGAKSGRKLKDFADSRAGLSDTAFVLKSDGEVVVRAKVLCGDELAGRCSMASYPPRGGVGGVGGGGGSIERTAEHIMIRVIRTECKGLARIGRALLRCGCREEKVGKVIVGVASEGLSAKRFEIMGLGFGPGRRARREGPEIRTGSRNSIFGDCSRPHVSGP